MGEGGKGEGGEHFKGIFSPVAGEADPPVKTTCAGVAPVPPTHQPHPSYLQT